MSLVKFRACYESIKNQSILKEIAFGCRFLTLADFRGHVARGPNSQTFLIFFVFGKE